MVFSSPLFIFLFLPLVLGVYFFLPWRFKNLFLLVSSLFFYFWGERFYTLVMIVAIMINYGFGLLLLHQASRYRLLVISCCVGINLVLLGYFKYYHFFLSVLQDVFGYTLSESIVSEPIHLPIGISFFTFQALSYVIDAYRKEVGVQKNPATLALYVSLFPQLIAGPIVRYSDVEQELEKRNHRWSEFAYGVERFVYGLAKKVLLANSIAYVVDKIFAIPHAELSTLLAWIGVVGYALQIYFDFSAYSDMAIGLGRMFGFRFLENFNYPYTALSIQDFWRRWHISLSTWFRDYLYIPLGGNRKGTFATYRNLLIVFFLTGLWHGASYNFIIWGLLHGLFLMIERAGLGRWLAKLPRLFRLAYVWMVVLVAWVFFRATDLSTAFSFLSKMYSWSESVAAEAHLLYLVDSYAIGVLVIGMAFTMPIRKLIFEDCFLLQPTAKPAKQILYGLLTITVFLLSVVYLAAGTYNPFIYFRF